MPDGHEINEISSLQKIRHPELSYLLEMKLHCTWMTLTLTCLGSVTALTQVQLVPDTGPQRVFAGEARQVAVVWRNEDNQLHEGEIRARILQTSSATAMLVSEAAWKRLRVLPQQTLLESAQLDFPAVKVETKFLVRWLENSNTVVGTTEVLVYPTNLLAELKPLAGDEPLGVFDPQNQLKPLLKNLNVRFADLENNNLENFSGRLAIIGPFPTKAQMREGLMDQIQALAKKGAAIVWLQPPPEKGAKLVPSFYPVASGTNAVIVIQPELVANLPGNPQSQLNLIYFCKLALQPQPFQLPKSPSQP